MSTWRDSHTQKKVAAKRFIDESNISLALRSRQQSWKLGMTMNLDDTCEIRIRYFFPQDPDNSGGVEARGEGSQMELDPEIPHPP